MRYLLLTLIFASGIFFSAAPPAPFTVKGKVTDASGQPLAGISIIEKGTKTATVSDGNGDFTITISSQNATIVISGVGYDTQRIQVNGKSNLSVSLKAAVNKLEEVVVVGYGIDRAEASTFSQPLMGRVAGVAVGGSGSYYKKSKEFDKRRNFAVGDTVNKDDQDFNTEDYDEIVENRFLGVSENPLSTFSIDVDAASYANMRRFLKQGQLPPPDAVRIEEMVNYFHYNYPQPKNEDPFSINTEIAACPWSPNHRLVLIGLQGKKIPMDNLPASNLVFLIDVSGSMEEENKLPLVQSSMKLLVDQLREQDKVSLVVYAGNAGLVLPPTSGAQKNKIKEAIDRLEAGGSTAGGAGIALAYKTAKEQFVKGGNNRVILCTDGDFNVGPSSDGELVKMIEKERSSGIFLTVLGYGMGNYKDNKMEKLADKGNGNHAYIDGISEARKVLVNEFGGTLFTIAKDVKLQVEFNPTLVQAYRLIGYENRLLNKEDFNNDKKDAGELGSGHTVTALYEVVPAGVKDAFVESVDKLKYQKAPRQAAPGSEILTVKFRYKRPDGDVSRLIEHPVLDQQIDLAAASENFRFAAAVAEFGLLLRNSEFKQSASYEQATRMAKAATGNDEEGYRSELLQLMKAAQSIAAHIKKTTADDDKSVGVNRK